VHLLFGLSVFQIGVKLLDLLNFVVIGVYGCGCVEMIFSIFYSFLLCLGMYEILFCQFVKGVRLDY